MCIIYNGTYVILHHYSSCVCVRVMYIIDFVFVLHLYVRMLLCADVLGSLLTHGFVLA